MCDDQTPDDQTPADGTAGALTGQIPAPPVGVGSPLPGQFGACENHREVQHRDGKPPWCDACGWNRGSQIPPKRYGGPR